MLWTSTLTSFISISTCFFGGFRWFCTISLCYNLVPTQELNPAIAVCVPDVCEDKEIVELLNEGIYSSFLCFTQIMQIQNSCSLDGYL